METYKYEKLRNIVVLGHAGCGKTTLVESLVYVTGGKEKPGRIEDKNTISDYDREETERGGSISTAVVPVFWEDVKVNFLDTPGYFDFVGEAEAALQAAQGAVIVISAKAGVEVGTIKAWELCERQKVPVIFFVTDMDDDNASYREVVEELQGLYGKMIAPFHSPIRENGKFVGFVNVVKEEGRRFTEKSDYEECDIPDYSREYVDRYREALLEAVAETDEILMEKYFEGEEFTAQEMSTAIRSSVIARDLIPVLMGSGLNCQGMTMLLQAIERYFPAPNKTFMIGTDVQKQDTFAADFDANKPMTARIFKTISDPFVGKYSLLQVCSGVLKADSLLYNAKTGKEDKISKLYVMRGKEQIEVKELYAGDIGAIAKFSGAGTGDTLSTKAAPVVFDDIRFSEPYTCRRIEVKKKGEEEKLSQGLAKLLAEDMTLKVVNDSENRQTLLYGIGEQQLEIAVSKLENRYKVQVSLEMPRIPYKETIGRKVRVQGKYKKQSGGHGQYGDVHMEFEPLGGYERSYEFAEQIFGGAVPKNFFPAVEKGIAESTKQGPLAGYPVVGVKATLVDGSYHSVDSSEMAFKMAAIQAFKQGFMEAGPILLEPIVTLKVSVPEKYTGDIMGDLNKRRGRVMGMDSLIKGKQDITVSVPLSEITDYSTELRSMTGGIGEYSYTFSRYEPAPANVQIKVIEESK